MDRFFGMMPSDEIEISKTFTSGTGSEIRVDAGLNGWTVTWADYSTNYEDNTSTAEDNFDRALDFLYDKGFNFKKIK